MKNLTYYFIHPKVFKSEWMEPRLGHRLLTAAEFVIENGRVIKDRAGDRLGKDLNEHGFVYYTSIFKDYLIITRECHCD